MATTKPNPYLPPRLGMNHGLLKDMMAIIAKVSLGQSLTDENILLVPGLPRPISILRVLNTRLVKHCSGMSLAKACCPFFCTK